MLLDPNGMGRSLLRLLIVYYGGSVHWPAEVSASGQSLSILANLTPLDLPVGCSLVAVVVAIVGVVIIGLRPGWNWVALSSAFGQSGVVVRERHTQNGC